jgi:hypothetical protein
MTTNNSHGGGYIFCCLVCKTRTMNIACCPGFFCVASYETTMMSVALVVVVFLFVQLVRPR